MMSSSCSPDKLAKGLSVSHSNTEGGTTLNYSEHSSLVKGMPIMTEDVDEDLCSESESGDEDLLAPEIEFNPRNFYWLFNPDLGFSQRATFDINEDINPSDFLAMRRINRSVLTSFFSSFKPERSKKLPEFNEKPAWGSERRAHESDEEMEEVKLTSMSSQMPPGKSSFVHDNLNLMWEDAALDKVAKQTLRVADYGRYIPLDMVAHLEFFYNTLLMSHETSNPFKRPRSYQALLHPYKTRGGSEQTLLEAHLRLTYPPESQGDPLFDSPEEPVLSENEQRKYFWYPNREISGNQSTYTVSPTPKRFEAPPPIIDQRPKHHASVSIKTFEALPKVEQAPVQSLSTALRRHTVVYQNPIFEREP